MATESDYIALLSSDPEAARFAYQLDMLRIEIGLIDNAIARIDGLKQGTKNWAITVWAGSLAVVIASQDLRPIAFLTALLPLMFWIIDARWSFYMRAFIYREAKISEFLNSAALSESFKSHQLLGLQILDPSGVQHKQEENYRHKVRMLRSLGYPENSLLFFGMMVVSIVIGVIL